MAQTEIFDNSKEILISIDKGFSSFGSSVGTVIYWKFEFTNKLNRTDIAKRPDLLSKTIREIFKDGSKVIEDAIILQLRSKFHLVDRKYVSLEDAINSINVPARS
jgi:hypothetical protein